MREILFRGKALKNNEWIYGFYHNETSKESPSSDRKVTRHHIYTQGFDLFVDPETICQYTGLCDKNGNKIYEGDILCMTFSNEWTNNKERKIYYSVKFTDGMFATFYKDYENGQWEDIEDNRLDKALIEVDKLEVVGNIYDNPEILEV